ncbi:competence protein ComK [Radiobacillus sp. PE A8.2]|uniref:competence protein ComK n=1 Tax=Radiobacillus sp. PE A8.2 TaxID=3380349 RepID=UPI00388F6F8E
MSDVLFAKQLGKSIRAYRTKHGMTLEELAGLIDMDAKHLGKMELGRKGAPSSETLFKLYQVLDIDINGTFDTNYAITISTMALCPARHIDYDTIVYERDRTLYVKKTPLQLIKSACIDYGASYDGRRAAVTHKLNFRKKVPIPISISYNIYAFPTQSAKHYDCTWIFFSHVKAIQSNHPLKKSDYKSIIAFQTGQALSMHESYFQLEKQMQRTAMCMLQFSPRLNNQMPRSNQPFTPRKEESHELY